MSRKFRLRYLVSCAYYHMQSRQTLTAMRRHAKLVMALDREELLVGRG